MSNTKKYLPYLSAATSSVIFGLSFLFSKKALALVQPFELLSFRFLTAFLIMSLLVLTGAIKVNYRNKPVLYLFFLGLCQPVFYFIFETYGIKYAPSSQAGLMIALIPVFVAVLGSYFLNEIPSSRQIIFIILSIVGVIFIILMGNSNGGSISAAGTILLLFAVLSAAFFNILSRKLSSEFSPIEITYFMMGLGALFFNIISIANHALLNNLTEYFLPLHQRDFLISVGYLGILSSLIAFFLINFTLSKISASTSSVFSNLSTIVTVAAGVIFLKENFSWYHILGAALILGGVFGSSFYQNSTNEEGEVLSIEE